MSLRVECGPGLGGEAEPLAVWFGSRRVGVREIVDRWFAPRRRWFRIDADAARAEPDRERLGLAAEPWTAFDLSLIHI